MKVGIVGMPNAGKSSLFNALTKAGAEAANYPFTTIDPNVAVVPVRDTRLDRTVAIKILPAVLAADHQSFASDSTAKRVLSPSSNRRSTQPFG